MKKKYIILKNKISNKKIMAMFKESRRNCLKVTNKIKLNKNKTNIFYLDLKCINYMKMKENN